MKGTQYYNVVCGKVPRALLKNRRSVMDDWIVAPLCQLTSLSIFISQPYATILNSMEPFAIFEKESPILTT